MNYVFPAFTELTIRLMGLSLVVAIVATVIQRLCGLNPVRWLSVSCGPPAHPRPESSRPWPGPFPGIAGRRTGDFTKGCCQDSGRAAESQDRRCTASSGVRPGLGRTRGNDEEDDDGAGRGLAVRWIP
jgi:hypothetical protein